MCGAIHWKVTGHAHTWFMRRGIACGEAPGFHEIGMIYWDLQMQIDGFVGSLQYENVLYGVGWRYDHCRDQYSVKQESAIYGVVR